MSNDFNLKSYQYQRSLEERRGNNFQYLNNDTYKELETKGYEFDKPQRSLTHAKEQVEANRSNGYYSRIVCWAQGQIRMKEYIVIRKKKSK
jgi:hypothetical protein